MFSNKVEEVAITLKEEINYTSCKDEFQLRCDELALAVYAIEEFRDNYFDEFPISEAHLKQQRLEEKVKETSADFEELIEYLFLARYVKSRFYYLYGRLLNFIDKYDEYAVDILGRSIKLDDKNVMAWNTLGEMYSKGKYFEDAITCFVNSINLAPTKEALRNLSVVFRSVPPDFELKTVPRNHVPPTTYHSRVSEALKYAQMAVDLNPTDGMSWGILGNALMADFFANGQVSGTLTKCVEAYTKTDLDPVSVKDPVVNYNWATALMYTEDYGLALEKYKMSVLLDPSWKYTREYYESAICYVNMLQDIHNGVVKCKRLGPLIKTLKTEHLGEHKGKSVKLLNELQLGKNKECVILGRVTCSFVKGDGVPLALGISDSSRTTCLVTIYNIGAGKSLPQGCTIAIKEPTLELKQFTHSDKSYEFRSIRVDCPWEVVINGKTLTQIVLASIVMNPISSDNK